MTEAGASSICDRPSLCQCIPPPPLELKTRLPQPQGGGLCTGIVSPGEISRGGISSPLGIPKLQPHHAPCTTLLTPLNFARGKFRHLLQKFSRDIIPPQTPPPPCTPTTKELILMGITHSEPAVVHCMNF